MVNGVAVQNQTAQVLHGFQGRGLPTARAAGDAQDHTSASRIDDMEGRGLLQPVLYCIGNAPSLGAAGEDLADGWIVQDAQGGKEAGRQRAGSASRP